MKSEKKKIWQDEMVNREKVFLLLQSPVHFAVIFYLK